LKQLEDKRQAVKQLKNNLFLVSRPACALLIGGVGSSNTDQVLLARLSLEIAMLKTTAPSP